MSANHELDRDLTVTLAPGESIDVEAPQIGGPDVVISDGVETYRLRRLADGRVVRIGVDGAIVQHLTQEDPN